MMDSRAQNFNPLQWILVALHIILITTAQSAAGQFGDFTFTDNGTFITITAYSTSVVGEAVIPDAIISNSVSKPVTSIGSSAFKSCSGLTSVTIPSSVKIIGDQAFYSCSGLTSVTIPSSVTSIGSYAFFACLRLTEIVVDSDNPNYSSLNGVLYNKLQTSLIQCPSALTGSFFIPSSVSTISVYAFYACSGLTSMTIPSSVTSIGSYAFLDCLSLPAIVVDSGNPNYSSLNGILYNKSKTSLIECPGGFAGSLSIPSTVKSIVEFAFYPCSGLTSVTIPSSVTSIGNYAFESCTSLTSVTIPSGVTSIGFGVFAGCSSLTSVAIPSSVTSIGSSAFSGCSGLTSVAIPSSVTSIGTSAFSRCSSLPAIVVNVANPNYSSLNGALFNKLQTSLIQCPGGLTGSFSIPSSVTSIGDQAFYYCSGLTSVAIPSSVTSIGSSAFLNCSKLNAIEVNSSNPNYSSLNGILFNKLQTSIIQCPGNFTGDFSIPSGVTSIGSNAFSSCGELTGVTIPSSVTSIGDKAFYSCSSLMSVAIPSGVTSIGSSAFLYCSKMTAIVVNSTNPNYSSLNGILFNKLQKSIVQCPGGFTGNFTIPFGVTYVGTYAFQSCSGLTSVTIPSTVTSIGGYGFYNCRSLTSAYFMGNAPKMGTSAFANAADGFTVYFFNGKAGFTSPLWNDCATVNMGEQTTVGNWLLTNGFPYNTDLEVAPNSDGVSLLMAYALNLNPTKNQRNNLPRPIIAANRLSMSFYGANTDVHYSVETSSDLKNWTSEGVSLSAPDGDGICTASMSIINGCSFLRLKVSK